MTNALKTVWTRVLLLAASCLLLSATGLLAADAGFAEKGTCQSCHTEVGEMFTKTWHSKAYASTGETYDCQSCHGPGAAHAESPAKDNILHFAKDGSSVKDQNASCQSCHASTPGMDLWDFSKHKRNDVSCASCHTAHEAGSPKPNEPEVCFSCHTDIKVQVSKRSHHPVKEGQVSCSSCHAPHGSMAKGSIKADDSRELCFSCHAEKRGPAVWEHPPVEENCQSCHTVHGSFHPRLLTERLPNLCQSFHDWRFHPGTPHDKLSSGTGRTFDCLRCHPAIHGSNSANGTGFRFVR